MEPDCATKLEALRDPVPKMFPEVSVTVPAVVLSELKLSAPPLMFSGEEPRASATPTSNEPLVTETPPEVERTLESFTVPALPNAPTVIGLPLAFHAPETLSVPPVAAWSTRLAEPALRVIGPFKVAIPEVPDDARVAV